MKRIPKILKIGFMCLVSVIVFVNIYQIISRTMFNEKMPMIFGFGSAVVVTGSMSPKIMSGDMIVIKSEDNYAIGDVVTYATDGTPVTHEIVELTKTGYITKGIANNVNDKEIEQQKVYGKVLHVVPGVGYVVEKVQTPLGIIGLIVIGFLIIEVPYWVSKARQRKDGNKKKKK